MGTDALSGGSKKGLRKGAEETIEGGYYVYRALRKGENPQLGLRARTPGHKTAFGSHIMGKRESNLISTTKDESIAREIFDNGNGVVRIDLREVCGPVHDLSNGFGRGRVYSRSKSHKEVLIEDTGGAIPPIPPSAIQVIKKSEVCEWFIIN